MWPVWVLYQKGQFAIVNFSVRPVRESVTVGVKLYTPPTATLPGGVPEMVRPVALAWAAPMQSAIPRARLGRKVRTSGPRCDAGVSLCAVLKGVSLHDCQSRKTKRRSLTLTR